MDRLLPLPASLPTRSQIAQATLVLTISFCTLAVIAAIAGPYSQFWWNDFRYFWVAGDIWNHGASPYLPCYIEEGRAISASFSAPFYYPPSIRPFVSALALLPMQQSAQVFFILNIMLLALSCRLLADAAAQIAPAADRKLVFAGFLFLAFLGLRQPLVVASIGQFTIIFLAAVSAFFYGVSHRRGAVVAAALAVLLMKPQIGAGLFALSFLDRRLRGPAMIAALANFAFTATGLEFEPAASAKGFIANVAQYTDHPTNATSHSAGLSYLLSLFGIEAPTAATLGLICAAALALRPSTTVKEQMFAALLVLIWSVCAAPTHATDFTMLAPAIFLIVAAAGAPDETAQAGRTQRRRVTAALLASALLLLGRSYELALVSGLSDAKFLAAVTIINTAALGVLLVFAAKAARFRGFSRPSGDGRPFAPSLN